MIMFLFPGVLREPRVPRRRPQDLPDAGDPRHRPLRALEDGALPLVPAGRAGGPGGEGAGAGAAVDQGLQGAEGHPHAARQVRCQYSFSSQPFCKRRHLILSLLVDRLLTKAVECRSFD